MFRFIVTHHQGALYSAWLKITRKILSRPLTWTRSVLWQYILTRCVRVCSSLYRKAQCAHTHTHATGIRCHNTDLVHVNGHDRTIFVILAKCYIRFPDDGPSVIRNILEHFWILCLLDRASSWQLNKERPSWCRLLFLFHYLMLNMFRMLVQLYSMFSLG
jgi:hypothetical protein